MLEKYKGDFMNITQTSAVNFGAIRTPFGYGNCTKVGGEVKDRILHEFKPNGIFASDYSALFFRNKLDEIQAERYLIKAGLPYYRSDLADQVDQDTRYEWATTGDNLVLNKWYRNNFNK